MSEAIKFWGKYRGKCLENIDPLFLNRILCDVPSVPCSELSWALPCSPYGGMQVGFVAVPPIGANVWVEFEGGDPTHPIWTGCFWTEGEKPEMALTPEQIVLKTMGTTLIFDDTPGEGGIKLEVGPPTLEVPVLVFIDAEGLQIEIAESIISMSPEEIAATVPPTVFALTSEGGSLTTEGTIDFTSDETTVVAANVAVEGTVDVTGDSNFTGAVEVEGDSNFTGAVEIEGDAAIVGAVEIEGDQEVTGAIEVVGDVAVAGAVEAADVAAAVLEGALV